MLSIEILLLIHAFATWTMIGIIWFVQVVYSPLYRRMKNVFSEYEKKDLKHMGYLIAPVFLFEIVSAIILAFVMHHDLAYRILSYINVGLLVIVWAITTMLQWKYRPADILLIHRAHHILVRSNWLRTLVWSARGVIVLCMVIASDVMK